MLGRLLRVSGTVLVIAAAFVTPVLVTSAPASADTVINGCTIVSNPTPTNFTNCPGADLSDANLSGADLSHANFAGASFANCPVTFPPTGSCFTTDLSGANLSDADLAGTSFFACTSILPIGPCGAATLIDANLTAANLSNASLAGCIASICAGVVLSGATLTGANLTNITCATPAPNPFLPLPCLVPTENLFATTNSTGAVFTWPTPQPLAGATPGTCTPPSGSIFPLGATTVTCQVLDDYGDVATGTFTVAVCGTTSSCNLKGVNLTDANLSGANLADANLSRANLAGARLGDDNLAGANFSGTNLAGAIFSGTYLAGANLSGANLNGAIFSATNLASANLSGTNLAGVSLSGTNLAGANLSRANLNFVFILGANLTGANLNNASLTGIAWSNTTCPDGTNSNNDGNTCVGHL